MIAPTSFFADYGCHVRILEEALALRRLGHKVTIATYHKGRPIADLEIVRTPPLPWHADYEVGSSRHKLAFDVYLGATVLHTALKLRRQGLDIIHAHLHEGALIGAPIARLLGIPLVFDFQGSLTGEMVDHHFLNPNGPFFKPMYQMERVINRLPKAILTSSSHARQILENEFEIPAERLNPLPDCVNADTFRPPNPDSAAERAQLKEQLGIPPGRPVVIYLGLLADYQGTPHLIQAAAQLVAAGVDAHFLIMGYPGQMAYVQMARDYGVEDRVTLPGRIPYEHAAHYLSLGDIAVAPKLSATEGSGKVLNYMAMGLPTVAFDIPVQREYLGDLGVYVPPGDVEAFAGAIGALIADPKRRMELGTACRQRVIDHYSWERAGRQIVSIYDQLSRGRL
jgi:glycosyltransferase involved in cell wall biosynthesis